MRRMLRPYAAMTAVGLAFGAIGVVEAQQQQQTLPQQFQQQQQQDRFQQQPQQQQQRQPGAQQAEAQPPEQMQLARANDLIGTNIENYQGENLGTVEDIVLGGQQESGRISYIAVRDDEWFGLTGELHAVPFEALQYDQEREVMLLDATPEEMEEAPGFDPGQWPERGDPRWGQVDQAFGIEAERQPQQQQQQPQPQQRQRQRQQQQQPGVQSPPGAATQPNQQQRPGAQPGQQPGADEPLAMEREMQFRRLTEVIGNNVENFQQEPLGQVEDIIVDIDRGAAAYAVVSYGGVLGIGEEQSVVPWTALQADRQRQIWTVDATQQQLDQTPFEDVQTLAEAEQAQQIHQQYQAQPYWEVFAMPRRPGMLQQQEMQAWQQLDEQFEMDRVEVYSGTVETIGTFRLDAQAAPGVRYRLRTDEDQVITVYAGPQQFQRQLERREGVEIRRGDEIEVSGAPAEVGRRTVLLAQEITKDDQTLELRDGQGRPNWQVEEGQQQQQQQEQFEGPLGRERPEHRQDRFLPGQQQPGQQPGQQQQPGAQQGQQGQTQQQQPQQGQFLPQPQAPRQR